MAQTGIGYNGRGRGIGGKLVNMYKILADLPGIAADKPVLIAGPTASGKSALALGIAREFGGVIVNADASQVYDCWRIITARPSAEEELQVPHHLYGHVAWDAPYSAGHWLREVRRILASGERVIIVGGTGLYFMGLTEGLSDIPGIPAHLRAEADSLTLETMQGALDPATRGAIDLQNRARVQRAWEVQAATGRGLADWQASTPAPVLPLSKATALVFDMPREQLETRIRQRFDTMLEQGARDEVAAMLDRYDPARPSCKPIGVPELVAYLRGEITLDQARERASIATRRFAKRQRTWFRSRMGAWHRVRPND
jgi:tRNA dimethylallyltransferase